MTEQKAIISLIIYFREGSKGFIGSLITTFFKADPGNFAKLQNEWPVLADVIRKYRTVDGYSNIAYIRNDKSKLYFYKSNIVFQGRKITKLKEVP